MDADCACLCGPMGRNAGDSGTNGRQGKYAVHGNAPRHQPGGCSKAPRPLRKTRWALRDYVFPRVGSKPIDSISSQDLLVVLKKIETIGKCSGSRSRPRRGGTSPEIYPSIHRQASVSYSAISTDNRTNLMNAVAQEEDDSILQGRNQLNLDIGIFDG
jgi:hypothetical protein